MPHQVHDEELFMEEALAAIRRAITDEAAGEMTLGPAEPRASREERVMRMLPHHVDWVVRLIGPERVCKCPSLPQAIRELAERAKS